MGNIWLIGMIIVAIGILGLGLSIGLDKLGCKDKAETVKIVSVVIIVFGMLIEYSSH